jgi:hypothetical protein
MLTNVVYQKQLPLQAVLLGTWYATKDLRLFIESLHTVYYCPLKANRQVDDTGGERAYQRVDALDWSAHELARGNRIKSKGFPKNYKVQLFRVAMSTHRTDYVVTNDQAQDSMEATQEACSFRWKIEVLQSQDIKFTRDAFFFLVDHHRWFFKGQHVMHFDRSILIHHDFFHQELDHGLALLIA